MPSYPDNVGPGSFIPTTEIYDVTDVDVRSEEFKDVFIRLQQTVSDIANSLNIRDAGFYVEEEFVNGQIWFPNPNLSSTTGQAPTFRQVFRKVINFGALPNTGTTNVAHSIAPDSTFTFTRIYGCASDTTGLDYLPIPFASPTDAENIKLEVDNTNVSITTGSNRSAFDTCYVVLEYIKQ